MIRRLLLHSLLISLLLCSAAAMADRHTPPPGVLELEDGFYYVVQKGDTLWDVSARFFNTAWYWPGLWAENDISISSHNPHWIYPGQKLRLALRGTISEPEPLPIITEKPLPEPEPPSYRFSPIHRVGFITPEPVEPSARIIAATESRDMISTSDRVYIAPSADRILPIAGRYIIYASPEKVRNPDNQRSYIGYLHYISGLVDITEHRNGLTIGHVSSAFRPIQEGDLLFPMPKRKPEIPLKPPVEGLEGKIIAGDLNQTMFAQEDIIYINFGKKDGVMPGQTYYLIEEKEISATGLKKDRRTDRIPFGAVFILDTRETASAAFVIDSRKNASIGTLVTSPIH
ncbi:LysM peptidoglycan-binding domain-containing protein [Desulfobotulus sp. H1]|uniref:LysM peptidoglycan-binding domain-containing protein n=1 Tax=Desulfobotulus pelophilus TaxID=2823377 RepID=A0ABT3N5G7_9BACT|nr:LysM domain-containing protein [Desulfobotulus pelophilus]MCW7752711.1 LysM peptidoglycan-binding domain-containing protein [Desulfobotulus pelophilus]